MTDRLHITPGRFQPPHAGHGLTINGAIQSATKDKAHHWIVPSRSEGSEQNPIPFGQKVALLQRLFPGQKVIDHPEVKNLFGALRHAANLGYKNIVVHAGEGRAQEYEQSIKPYIKNPDDPEYDPQKHFPFDSFQVVQSGKRDEAGEGVTGFSGTKARSSTRSQYRGMAPTQDPKLADEIYNAMRKGQAVSAKAKAAKQKTRGRRKLAEEISHEEFKPMMNSFAEFVAKELKLKKIPIVHLKDPDDHDPVTSFGGYNPHTKEILLQTKNRHPMDIFRTLAHEFVHAKQHEDDKIGKDIEKEGETGSCYENEANAIAGVIMRKFGKANPKNFELEPLKEAIFIVGGPCSGKDKVVKLIKEQSWLPEFDISALTQKQPQEERIIINAPAHNLDSIRTANQMLKDLNYKTSMIFVDVENNISKLRNEQRANRGQRVINESVRFEKYSLSQKNLECFVEDFDYDILIVDNSETLNELKTTGPDDPRYKDPRYIVQKAKGLTKRPGFDNMIVRNNKVIGQVYGNDEKGWTSERSENRKRLHKLHKTKDDAIAHLESKAKLDEGRCWKGYRPVKGKSPFSKGSCEKVAESLHDWFKSRSPKTGARGWVQVGGKYDGYPCARQEGQKSTPKCRSSEERSRMSKKEKTYAFKKKNREDPNQPQKSGGAKPTMVKTYKEEKDHEYEMVRNQLRTAMQAIQKLMKHVKGEGELEAWVQSKITKASDYIDSVADYLGSQDSEVKEAKRVVKEAKDACYHKVKARYDVFPSAYASGALVKCRKVGAANWGNKSKKIKESFLEALEEKRKVETEKDKDFIKYMEQPANREWGKTSTVEIYKKMTPGQYADDKLETASVNVYPTSLHEKEDCGCEHEGKKKKKILRKRLAQEAEGNAQLTTASGAIGLPVSDSIGAEFGVAKSPSIIAGLTGVTPVSQGATALYPFGTYGIAESVQKWLMKEETQQKFKTKYGDLAEQKLIETGINITKSMNTNVDSKPKSFSQLREESRYPSTWSAGGPSATDSTRIGSSSSLKDGDEKTVDEDWSDVKHQDPRGGLKASGVRAYRRENPGSKLKTAVREDPSKLKKGGKRWKRRQSYCARSAGQMKMWPKAAKDPNSRLRKARRAWNCEE